MRRAWEARKLSTPCENKMFEIFILMFEGLLRERLLILKNYRNICEYYMNVFSQSIFHMGECMHIVHCRYQIVGAGNGTVWWSITTVVVGNDSVRWSTMIVAADSNSV